jgi:arginine decarboxylase
VKWTLDDTRLVYGLAQKDLHFLDVTSEGDLYFALGEHRITLAQVTEQARATLKGRGYMRASSFTLRVPQLISTQIAKVVNTFNMTMKQQRYHGALRLFYSVKANPRSWLVREVLSANPACGLEVGTRWELSLALRELADSKQRLIMCNGVKGDEYIETLRMAILEGYQTVVSIESPAEVPRVLGRLPRDRLQLALRIKPYVEVESHWRQATGRNGKFGLAIHDLLEVLALLKSSHVEASVTTVHAHPGSEVLGGVSTFAEFLAHVYVYLRQSGFSNVNAVDVGGGLPIDYTGYLGKNPVRDHARALVKTFVGVLGKQQPHPDLMVEAGRVATAPHALLVVRILGLHNVFPSAVAGEETDSHLLRAIGIKWKDDDSPVKALQAWHRWQVKARMDGQVHELLQYERRSGVLKTLLRHKFVHSATYQDYLSDPRAQDLLRPDFILIGDFSVFSGAIDHILASQYFPVLPIHYLNQVPATLARLVDITCDSDGEISTHALPISRRRLFTQDEFPLTANRHQVLGGFPIGRLDQVVGDYVVIPLVGAYQDSIRMDGRLVGALPDVELRVNEQGDWIAQWLGAEPPSREPS